MTSDTQHRPWALPSRRWAMTMNWHDLLFMHWPIRPELLRPLIPPALELGIFDGSAWIGVVPFRMSGVRPRYIPVLPWLSAFPELNVRTYVESHGKPGVWFFSLDATNPVAVWGARRTFHLPYYHARMAVSTVEGGVRYQSQRIHRGAPPAAFVGYYEPVGPVYHAAPGTLDHWLTERYCLYAADPRGRVWRGDIHHNRWPLQAAQAHIDINTMTDPIGLPLPDMDPLLHFASRLNVVAWQLKLLCFCLALTLSLAVSVERPVEAALVNLEEPPDWVANPPSDRQVSQEMPLNTGGSAVATEVLADEDLCRSPLDAWLDSASTELVADALHAPLVRDELMDELESFIYQMLRIELAGTEIEISRPTVSPCTTHSGTGDLAVATGRSQSRLSRCAPGEAGLVR